MLAHEFEFSQSLRRDSLDLEESYELIVDLPRHHYSMLHIYAANAMFHFKIIPASNNNIVFFTMCTYVPTKICGQNLVVHCPKTLR